MPAFEPCSPPSPPPISIVRRDRPRKPARAISNPSFPVTDVVVRALRRAGAGEFGSLIASTGQLEQIGSRFTVLAPSDAALAELPDELVGDPAALHRLLAFHLITGEALASRELSERDYVPSSHGQRLGCEIDEQGAVLVDGAALVHADLPAAGGVLHVIDRVLQPAELDLLELLWLSDSHPRLITACEVLGLEDRLRGSIPFTLLAPRGLTTMPTWRWHALLQPSGHASLRALIHRHLIPGRVYLDGSGRELRARNLEGRALTIERSNGQTSVAGRRVRAGDIEARNGLVHVIEGMLGA
ncbi:fasciclin domain-containing protein [Nannocystaceae bacterium ST9]